MSPAASVFFTKKQKKLMRERRRKKKLMGNQPPPNQAPPQDVGSKKQSMDDLQKESYADIYVNDYEIAQNLFPQLDDETSDFPILSNTPNNELPSKQNQVSNTNTSNVVRIPAGLSSRAAKKFRKEARRQCRLQGRDESLLQFVIEGEENQTASQQNEEQQSRKRKRIFPRINDLLQQQKESEDSTQKRLANENVSEEYKSQYVALDCEMVGIGRDGKQSALARVSMVDWDGRVLLDTFVQVPVAVTDFRTHVSGVRPSHLRNENAMDEKQVRKTVARLLQNKILVGHALSNDLSALLLSHPKDRIRDTAKYRPFQRRVGGNSNKSKWRPRKLRDLVLQHCGLTIQQEGQSHDSVDDARATMELFKTVHKEWEKEFELKDKKKNKRQKTN
jgi:RNA exonuclease 4